MVRRSKTDASSTPQAIADDLRIPERMMLFCLASGTRASASARFKLTPLGRDVPNPDAPAATRLIEER